jgi:hypothetical protein
MEPQEKAHSLFIKFMDIVQDVKQAKELSQLFVNETIESFLISLKDYQVEFWIEVKKEIEKI